ncbi:hypothetical protein SCP_0302760 [Sparassis crispa]|uniref:UbiA prenyltransferase n=1 Tax=Sparassis crispa TaxID=139825 RepID=A0A401GEJ6_9APHY|nr:hypothetical protein SCP_0302760 [Sparassis crispa]GBE80561.1 hypothetical protein SCP_0302760 [Sparassis crispa]
MPALAKAALQMSALSFPLCAIVFGVNDVYDYESDLRNPRKKAEGMEGGILNPVFHKDVLTAAYWSSAIVMTAAMVCGEPQNVLANAVLVTLGWQYSSPPFRLKEIPVVDSISNGLIVFLAWFIGFSFSGRSIAEAPAKGYMMSLCTAGVHALGAVMDTEADRAAGQKTIAVVLGKRCAAIFAAMCYVIASTTVDANSIFGVYVRCGILIMVIPCIRPTLAHRAFQAIVYFSITMAIGWIGVEGKSRASKILTAV